MPIHLSAEEAILECIARCAWRISAMFSTTALRRQGCAIAWTSRRFDLYLSAGNFQLLFRGGKLPWHGFAVPRRGHRTDQLAAFQFPLEAEFHRHSLDLGVYVERERIARDRTRQRLVRKGWIREPAREFPASLLQGERRSDLRSVVEFYVSVPRSRNVRRERGNDSNRQEYYTNGEKSHKPGFPFWLPNSSKYTRSRLGCDRVFAARRRELRRRP
jgi:hypothetical protein